MTGFSIAACLFTSPTSLALFLFLSPSNDPTRYYHKPACELYNNYKMYKLSLVADIVPNDEYSLTTSAWSF